MSEYSINLYHEGVEYHIDNERVVKNWLESYIKNAKYAFRRLSIIFCTDEYLYKLNKEFLNHHTNTDILTFDHAEKKMTVDGELYISMDRVKENATKFKVKHQRELLRVIIHGLLHLTGYDDKSIEERKGMRVKEEEELLRYDKLLGNVSRET